MNGALQIQKKLYADATTKAYTSSKIAIGSVEPTGWALTDKTCLIYQIATVDDSINYYQGQFTVNCRAPKESEASILAGYVVAALNRRLSTDGAYFTTATGSVIPPADTTDNFNIPVTVIVKGRS